MRSNLYILLALLLVVNISFRNFTRSAGVQSFHFSGSSFCIELDMSRQSTTYLDVRRGDSIAAVINILVNTEREREKERERGREGGMEGGRD